MEVAKNQPKQKEQTQEELLEGIMPDINTKYAYVLAQKNEKRGKVYDENGNPRNEVEYKPYLNVILRSPIIWDGKIDPFSGKPRAKGVHQIRYYDGCTTLFIDDQPKEKATIDELLTSTREVNIIDGFVYIFGYDSMLKLYMDWCSFNEESPYRVPTKQIKFKPVDHEKQRAQEANILEVEDEARDLAKNAPVKKMRVHAKFLGIEFQDTITGYELSDTAIRTEYRKAAKKDAQRFKDTYNNKALEVTNWITEALAIGEISTIKIPNVASWKAGGVILELEGLKSQDLIIQRLVEFTLIEEGADFLAQLKALYS